eukprot:4603641-Lingulodinium_polyedra.AAC.1
MEHFDANCHLLRLARDVAGGTLGFSSVLSEIPQPGEVQDQDSLGAESASSASIWSATISQKMNTTGSGPPPSDCLPQLFNAFSAGAGD